MRLTILILFLLYDVTTLLAQGPDSVLLVVNDNNADSRAIGRYYAEKRKIPAQNICHLATSDAETVGRDTFEREILKPVARHLSRHRLEDQILYIVTTRGLPLVVQGTDGPVGDMASVDSELTLTYQYLAFGVHQFNGRL